MAVIIGTPGNDTLNGTADADLIDADAGNDVIVYGEGADTVYGGDGNDDVDNSVAATLASVSLYGGAGNDTLRSSNGHDLIFGGANNDILESETGNDTLHGDDGTDRLYAFGGDDTLYGGAGADLLYGGTGNDTLEGGDGADRLDGGNDADVFLAGTGDTVFGAEGGIDADILRVSAVASLTYSGGTNEAGTITFTAAGGGGTLSFYQIETILMAGAVQGTHGNDTMAPGFTDADGDSIDGGDGDDDTIFGGVGDDTLSAGAGQDTLSGGTGNDWLDGGAGADSATGEGGDDTILGGEGADVLDGGGGHDRIEGGAGNDSATGGDGNDTLDESLGDGDDSYDGGGGDDTLTGGSGNDLLDGGLGDDSLDGGADADTLRGGAGLDLLQGGGGTDTLEGGGQTDRLFGGDGDDLLQGGDEAAAYVGPGTLTDAGGANHAAGSALSLDGLFAQTADPEIQDATAAPHVSVIGTGTGGGEEWYVLTVVDPGTRLVFDIDHAGTEPVGGPGHFDSYLNLYDAVLTSVGEDDDSPTTDGAGGSVSGYDSHLDITLATAGTYYIAVDDFNGGGPPAGATFTLQVSAYGAVVAPHASAAAGDTIEGGAGNDRLEGGAGDDLLDGGDDDDTLDGGTGDDTLDGGTGDDTMQGGAGNDTFVVDAAGDAVADSAGTETVQAWIDYVLPAGVERLALLGAAATGTGNALDNLLTGSALANTLDGAAGNDTMLGGQGDDTYAVDAAGDVVVEAAAAGTDTVRATLDYTLGTHLEALVLLGAAVTGTGNTLDNTLTGSALDNTLNGHEGADTMLGGLGDDRYFVGAAGDVVVEYPGQGTDTVISYLAAYTLGADLERLVLRGAAVTGTGNAAVNTLAGSDRDNTLDGGAGVDWLVGGAGDDLYRVGTEGDIVMEHAGQGTDTVRSAAFGFSLPAATEHLILDPGAVNGGGNTLDNALTGNAGANTLNGRAGADTLTGGAGADRLNGGADADVFLYTDPGDSPAGPASRDTIGDFAAGDRIDLSALAGLPPGGLAFRGTAPLSGTGPELRIAVWGPNAVIEIDTTGDGSKDMEILSLGYTAFTGGDFTL